jgi:hypothetical protein
MKISELIKRNSNIVATRVPGSPAFFSIILVVEPGTSVPLLKNAISSVLTQKFTDLELIVVDDSEDVENRHYMETEMRSDDRISYIAHQKSTRIQAIAIYEGIHIAEGEYFLLLKSSGFFAPNALSELKAVIDKKSFRAGCCAIDVYSLDRLGEPVLQTTGLDSRSQGYLNAVNFLPEMGMVLHRSVPDAIGYADPHFAISNSAILDYWKRISACYQIERLNIKLGTDQSALFTKPNFFGTNDRSVLSVEWTRYLTNTQLSANKIQDYDICETRHFSNVASIEFASLYAHCKNMWWFDWTTEQDMDRKAKIEFNESKGKILILSHEITASTTIPFGQFEEDFFHSVAFRDLKMSDLVNAPGIILSRSLFNAEAINITRAAKAAEIPIFYFLDDNFEVLGNDNPAYSRYTTANIINALREFKGVIVPNNQLAQYCEQRSWHENVLIAPPTIRESNWYDQPVIPGKHPNKKRVAFLGGSHRSGEFRKYLLPALVKVCEKIPLELILVGPHTFSDIELGSLEIHRIPHDVSYQLTICRLSNLEVDALVHAGSQSPNNPFKTPNALLNAWELKAVPIVANQDPYLQFQSSELALIATSDSISSWVECLESALLDMETAKSIMGNLNKFVETEYSGRKTLETIKFMFDQCAALSLSDVQQRYRALLNLAQKETDNPPNVPLIVPDAKSRNLDLGTNGFAKLYEEIVYTVTPQKSGWNGITIKLGSFNQQAFGNINMRIYEGLRRTPIVDYNLDLSSVSDNQNVEIRFPPIAKSQNGVFTIRLTRPRTSGAPPVAIYEKEGRESPIRRFLRRHKILKRGRTLACELHYAL